MKIQQNISLKPYNTFGIDVNTTFFTIVKNEIELIQIIKTELPKHQKHLFIGGGSNVLFCNNFDGLIIKNEIEGIEIISEDENTVTIEALSGTNWHKLVLFCIENNFGGIENLSLIPGTVGAAPMQNIGAYGVELKDVFVQLKAINLETGKSTIFNKNECNFEYRQSIFKTTLKNKYFIFSVQIQLQKNPIEFKISYGDIEKTLQKNNVKNTTIKAISDAVIEIRESKLPNPKILGNAGSFFKNPTIEKNMANILLLKYPTMPFYDLPNNMVKIPAGWLIETAELKGKIFGNTGNHQKQALVIVNYGNATGNEIWQHALFVQQKVKEIFGIDIEAEVNIIN